MTDPPLEEIQHAAKYGSILFTSHANDRLDDRNLRHADVLRAIETAQIAAPQGDGKARVSGGVDVDGVGLEVVCKLIHSGLLIITLF